MLTAQEQHTPQEVMERGKTIYNEKLRSLVEIEENIGKFIAIEVFTGDYELGEDHLETLLRLRSRHADPVTCSLRIGYPATFSRGVRMQPLPR